MSDEKLHEYEKITSSMGRYTVPGGWIYLLQTDYGYRGVFVPYPPMIEISLPGSDKALHTAQRDIRILTAENLMLKRKLAALTTANTITLGGIKR